MNHSLERKKKGRKLILHDSELFLIMTTAPEISLYISPSSEQSNLALFFVQLIHVGDDILASTGHFAAHFTTQR